MPLTREDIISYYRSGCKKPSEVAIGMEVEKHGIYQDNHKPITYLGKKGLKAIQEKLIEELGWRIAKQEDDFLMTLERCGSRITLETPESESELSGRTHRSIHDLVRELQIHQHEQSVISKIFGVLWIGIGIQPFAKNSEIRLLQTPRYKILYQYLKRQGGLYEEELKKTASVQTNIDYTSETDARKKFQTLLRLSPFLAAMYAHSPINEGKLTGFVSFRLHVLTHNDPDRFGIRKIFFERDFGFHDWVDFVAAIPMIAIRRNEKWIPVKNLTFQQFLERGYKDFVPILDDWITHTGLAYPFARMKQYIELRICDSIPPYLIPSLQAFIKAFAYHCDGERVMKELTKSWTFHDFEESYEKIAKHGMHTKIKGHKLLDLCKELMNIATTHLHSFHEFNERKIDEAQYLLAMKDFVFVKEKSPGMHVAEQWEEHWKHNPDRLIEWCRYD